MGIVLLKRSNFMFMQLLVSVAYLLNVVHVQ